MYMPRMAPEATRYSPEWFSAIIRTVPMMSDRMLMVAEMVIFFICFCLID